MTVFNTVNIGATANDGTGAPLRDAFNTINTNFANIASNALGLPVVSVAGRGGNVALTVNDVLGAASVAYVNTQMAYTMANSQCWTSNVYTISSALDQIAERLTSAGF
jgi:hypothetical protein